MTIPAGSDFAYFPVAGVSPSANTAVYAFGLGYPSTMLPVVVLQPTITMEPAPASLEVGSVKNIVVSRPVTESGGTLTVALRSSDESTFTLLSSATETNFGSVAFTLRFGPGANSGAIQIYGVGNGSAILTASIGTSYSTSIAVSVATSVLQITPDTTNVVAGGRRTVTVTRSGGVSEALDLTFVSSDPSKLGVMTNVGAAIQAGVASATFEVRGIAASAVPVVLFIRFP